MVRKTYAIIVAAGSGHRFGSPLPKQFCDLAEKPVLVHTIERMRRSLPDGSEIALVLHPDYFKLWKELSANRPEAREDYLVAGGACRAESVANALNALPESREGDVVMVHDGVRPFVNENITSGLYEAIDAGAVCAIPTVAMTDSIREQQADGNRSRCVDRSRFRAVQTPQAFPLEVLRKAYLWAADGKGLEPFTDDASVIEAYIPDADIRLTEGSPYNMKITNPLDIKIAEALMK